MRDFVTKVGYRRWKWTAKSLSTLIADIVRSETVHTENPTITDSWEIKLFFVSRSAMYIGWPMTPTRRSETARLQSKIMDVERIDGVLLMAPNTTALPRMDMSISGTFRRQIIVKIVFGLAWSSLFKLSPTDPLLSFPMSFIISVCVRYYQLVTVSYSEDNNYLFSSCSGTSRCFLL